MYSVLYEKFLKRIAEKTDIKHIDIYFGQYEGELDTEDPFLTPAAFIEFASATFESSGNGAQKAELIFRIHVVDDVMAAADSRTPESVRSEAHAHLKNITDVSKALNGFNGGNPDVQFTSCTRTGIEAYKANGMMIIHVIDFSTRVTDRTLAKDYTAVETTGSVSVTNASK